MNEIKFNYEIPQEEINKYDTLDITIERLLEDANNLSFPKDAYPFPHQFALQAKIYEIILQHPAFEGRNNPKNFHHIFSEEVDSEDIFSKFWAFSDDTEKYFELPGNESEIFNYSFDQGSFFETFYLVRINGNPAIFYSGREGYSSSTFSFWGVIC